MGNLDPKGILAAVEVAFYSISFCLGAFILTRSCLARKNGSSIQFGWLYIITLSILRIVGASILLYVETNNDYSEALLVTAAIVSSVGTAPLLLLGQVTLSSLHTGMRRYVGDRNSGAIGSFGFTSIRIFTIAAAALAIAGGNLEFSHDRSTSESRTGQKIFEASAILFVVVWALIAGIALLTLRKSSNVVRAQLPLLYAVLASLPFLLVRVVFAPLVAFAKPGDSFYYYNINVYDQAFLLFLMEACVIIFFVVAGFLTPPESKIQYHQSAVEQGPGMYPNEHGTPAAYDSRHHGPKQGDYRAPEYATQTKKPFYEYLPTVMLYKYIKSRV